MLERRRARADQLPVERVVEYRHLRPGAAARCPRRELGARQHHREIHVTGLPVLDRVVDVEQLCATDQLLEAADPERGHDPPDLLGDQHQVVDHVIRGAVEAFAELGILRRDPDGARVQVTDAHHDAAHRDQRGGGETEFVGAEQRPDDDIAAGLHLTVDLDRDPGSQVVHEQRLLGLGKADLPRHAGALHRGLRRGAGAAVVAGDRHVVGIGFGHADSRL